MHRSSTILFISLITFTGLSGCAAQSITTSHSAAPAALAWSQKRGGTITGHSLNRVKQVAHPLVASLSTEARPIRLHVLNCDSLTAYAWPTGEIYVSRGLVDALSSDELAAAIAHEMGHLVAEGHVGHPVTLDGTNGDHDHPHDHEQQADALGCRILTTAGLPAAAMSRMLQKVHDAQPAASPLRPPLQSRITALSGH